MKRAILVCGLVSALLAITASAVPINLTVDSTGLPLNGSGVANGTQYGQGNNNPTSNLDFLNNQIDLWNLSDPDPDLPPAIAPVALNVGSINAESYTAVAGYDYIVFHFGKGQAKDGPWWQAWYLNGEEAEFSLPTVDGQEVGGFSSARYFNQHTAVPDGGATLMLLGGAFGAIAIVRRRFLS